MSIESLFVFNKKRKSPIICSHSKEHEPIILNGNSSLVLTDLKSLCHKGPPCIPTPLHVDWIELQKDFDAFLNRLRARFILKSSQTNSNNNSNSNNKNNSMSINQLHRKKVKLQSSKNSFTRIRNIFISC